MTIFQKGLQFNPLSVIIYPYMSKTTQQAESPIIEEMFQAGAHFGYSKTRRHPSMSQFVFTTKKKADILNLEMTNDLLEKAQEFIKTLAVGGKQILFVGTKPEAKKAILDAATATDMPFAMERWVGGILTNFPEIKKRIDIMEDLKDRKEKGELDKYTKKERLLMDGKVEKLSKYYSGLVALKKPAVMVVVDTKKEHIAVEEAKRVGIPVIGLLNSDCDIQNIDYPIVANDSSTSSIKFFTEALVKAFKEAQLSK